MNSLCCFPSMGSDQVSIEENSDGFSFRPEIFDSPFDGLELLFSSDLLTDNFDVAGVCQSEDLVESLTHCGEPSDFDKYLGLELLSNPSSDIDQNLLVLNSLPVYGTDKSKKTKSNKKPIALSSSVGVGVPQRSLKSSHKIEIVNELEEKYRPRYKSDYFAQNGTQRKPRYVADRHGNHYITVKVPTNIQGRVRVDWLTIPTENGDRYYMPYRFQADNNNAGVLDCNPIDIDINSDPSGTMKLYLVLIKAKQDALKSHYPLMPFHPMQDALGKNDKTTPEKISKLTPKQLIQKYQLGKSQLAFTFCTIGIDGQSCPEWDTTAISSILEEEASDVPVMKKVACPNCAFEIPINDDGVTEQETGTNKRKGLPIKAEKPKTVKKQKSLPELYQCFD